MVERATVNRKATGSTPVWSDTFYDFRGYPTLFVIWSALHDHGLRIMLPIYLLRGGYPRTSLHVSLPEEGISISFRALAEVFGMKTSRSAMTMRGANEYMRIL